MPSVIDLQDSGPDFPLGSIAVAVPGTPVCIMSLVDTDLSEAPENSNKTGGPLYAPGRFQQIQFQALKPGVAHGLQNNTGNIYIVRKTGNRDDTGLIIACLTPGQTWVLASAPSVRDVYNAYRYYIDSDQAGDCAQVVGLKFG